MLNNEGETPKPKIYNCLKCNYKTHRSSHWKRHIKTIKHNKDIVEDNENTGKTGTIELNKKNMTSNEIKFNCDICGKIYKHRQSLNNHKKKYGDNCNDDISKKQGFIISHKHNENNNLNQDWKEMFLLLLEQNQKLMDLTVSVASQPKTINNQFNILNYLNTECKDAINLSEFIEQLEYNFNDLVQITDEGWVNNVENTFVKGLREMDQHLRPIHCCDIKRKKFYVKDDNIWGKDDKLERINKALYQFHNKQSQTYINWKKQHKLLVEKSDTLHDKSMYMNIELCKVSSENGIKLKNKIMSSLTELVISKNYNKN